MSRIRTEHAVVMCVALVGAAALTAVAKSHGRTLGLTTAQVSLLGVAAAAVVAVRPR